MLRWRSPIRRRVRIMGPTISPPASRVMSRIGQAAADRFLQPPEGAAANVQSAPGKTMGTSTGASANDPADPREPTIGFPGGAGEHPEFESRRTVGQPRRGEERIGALGCGGCRKRPDDPARPRGIRSDGALQAGGQELDPAPHGGALGEVGQRPALSLGKETREEDDDERNRRRQVRCRLRPSAAQAPRISGQGLPRFPPDRPAFARCGVAVIHVEVAVARK